MKVNPLMVIQLNILHVIMQSSESTFEKKNENGKGLRKTCNILYDPGLRFAESIRLAGPFVRFR